MTRKVKMLKTYTIYKAGKTHTLPNWLADQLVGDGFAKEVAEKRTTRKKVVAEPEG